MSATPYLILPPSFQRVIRPNSGMENTAPSTGTPTTL
jgi:hypothetical protein